MENIVAEIKEYHEGNIRNEISVIKSEFTIEYMYQIIIL